MHVYDEHMCIYVLSMCCLVLCIHRTYVCRCVIGVWYVICVVCCSCVIYIVLVMCV